MNANILDQSETTYITTDCVLCDYTMIHIVHLNKQI